MNEREYKKRYRNHQETIRLYADKLEDIIDVKISNDIIGLLKLMVMEMNDQTKLMRDNMKEGGVLNGVHNKLKQAVEKVMEKQLD